MADVTPRRGSPTQFAIFRFLAGLYFVVTFGGGGELPPHPVVRVAGVGLGLALMLGWKRRVFASLMLAPWIVTAAMMDGPAWSSMALGIVMTFLLVVIPEGEAFALKTPRRESWGVAPAWMTLAELFFFGGGWYAAYTIYKTGSVVPVYETGFLCQLGILAFLVIDARWIHPTFTAKPPVVFFDGVCGLCNHFIDWLFIEDANGVFRVSALQSEYAQKTLGDKAAQGELPPGSVVLTDEKGTHDKSTAVILILSKLGGILRWTVIFLLLPKFIRDSAYLWVAKNRYKWFGKKETCRLPTKEERSKFLQ